jgi:hypothetical protein
MLHWGKDNRRAFEKSIMLEKYMMIDRGNSFNCLSPIYPACSFNCLDPIHLACPFNCLELIPLCAFLIA